MAPANAGDTRDAGLISGLRRSPGEGNDNLLQYSWVSLVVQMIKNPPANAGDAGGTGLILGLERSPGEGNSKPLQYSCLENSMDRRAWQATVLGFTKRWIPLSE